MAQPAPAGKSPATWGVVVVLLAVAIVGTLWVPIYARSMPELGLSRSFTGTSSSGSR